MIEQVRVEKEEVIKEDALVEEEKKDLWEEADKLQKKRDDLLARNAVVDSENERIQAKFEEQMKDRSILEDNDTKINEKLKSTYEELQQCVDQRQNLRKISSQIDTEHNRLKSLLENMQSEAGVALFDTALFKKMNILFEWIFWILKKWIFFLNEYSGF